MSDKITDKVKTFYEKYPYPNQRVEINKDLLSSRQKDVMKNILSTVELRVGNLDGLRVLDAGCGTGEKALFCKMYGAEVDAFDLSKISIEIAKNNCKKLGLEVNYFQADFAKLKLKREYDLILAIGSLHHSADAEGNFYRVAKELNKNGRIVLGLYNLYGRLGCRIHRKILGSGKRDAQSILKDIKADKINNKTKIANIADRFCSPHETYHDIEQVLNWFDKAGILAVNTYPKVELKSKLSIKLKQLQWLYKKRGFFFIGGKKRN